MLLAFLLYASLNGIELWHVDNRLTLQAQSDGCKLQSLMMNYLSCVNCLFISVLNCLIPSLWRIAHYQLQRGRRSLREI